MKRIILYFVFSSIVFTGLAQKIVSKISNRYYFSVNPVTTSARKLQLKQMLEKEIPVVKKFEEIQQTGIFIIETFNEAQAEKIKEVCKKQGIELKQDELILFSCTTPPFLPSDLWSNMGYWNSLASEVWTEKQNIDSIYWVIKANFWNSQDDAGEIVRLSLSEIPNGNHFDWTIENAAYSFDYLRNTVIEYSNKTVHGSGTAGPLAKINNASLPAFDGGMAGISNVNRPLIKNVGDANFGYKTAQLAAMQACINEVILTGEKRILSVSFLLTTGADPEFDAMFTQADATGKVLFVIGAGNNNEAVGASYAAVHSSTLIVQASDGKGVKAGFSNYNAPISFNGVSTRGLDVNSNTNIPAFNGTSAATPHVASAAHLLWSLLPSKTAGEIKGILIDPKHTTTFITNPSGTTTPALRIGYLIQNLHFDIVHDYPTPVDATTNAGLLDLTNSVHDIQGGTISNATYWYQQNQTGAWVQVANGIINKQQLGNGRHNVKLRFDIQHQPGKCTEIVRSIQITNAIATSITDPQNPAMFIRITPNPASQLLNITGLSSSKIYQYVLSDYTGRSLLNGKISQSNQQQININTIPAGVYLLRLYSVQQKRLLGTEKIIIVH